MSDGTSRFPWIPYGRTNNATASAPDTYRFISTALALAPVYPAAGPSDGVYWVPFPLAQRTNNIKLMFVGADSTGANFRLRLWGWRTMLYNSNLVPVGWWATYQLTADLTLCTAAVSNGVFSGDNVRPVDLIEILDDATNTPPGARLIGVNRDTTPANTPVALLLDSLGFDGYIIHLQRLTGDTNDNIGPILTIL